MWGGWGVGGGEFHTQHEKKDTYFKNARNVMSLQSNKGQTKKKKNSKSQAIKSAGKSKTHFFTLQIPSSGIRARKCQVPHRGTSPSFPP